LSLSREYGEAASAKEPTMLTNPTIETLKGLKLHDMIEALEEQQQTPAIHALAFDERLAIIVDRERLYRDNQRRTRLLRGARLHTQFIRYLIGNCRIPFTNQLSVSLGSKSRSLCSR
jgi:hypothetical protein